MDSEGNQRYPSDPSAILPAMLSKQAKLHEELRAIEKQVYDMETSYLLDPSQCGNVLKGFEGFLSSSKNTALLKRSRKFQSEDRLFSLSSITSPAPVKMSQLSWKVWVSKAYTCTVACMALLSCTLAAEDQALGRDDAGPGRYKGSGLLGNGPGKPKKGRGAARDGKRIRPVDLDYDYEDDPDMM